MRLDSTFIILSTLLIGSLIPLYIYRKRVFPFAYRTGNLDLFIKDIKQYMKQEYPNLEIDYSIIKKTKDEKDIKVRETLIVENIINQFFYYAYEKNTQGTVSKEKLWTNYEKKSFSNPKFPSDWKERRALSWQRDNGKCNRCGTKMRLEDTFTTFAKDIDEGGGYNLENIIILCSDCNKVINSENPKNSIASLQLNDKLMLFVDK